MAGTEPSDAAVRAFEEAGGDAHDPEIGRVVSALGEHAPALLPLVLSDPSIPADVLARSLSRGETERSLRALFLDGTADLPDGPELYRALRRLRHRAVVRVALREVLRLADIDRTSAELADLAAAALDAALVACR